MSWTMQMQWTYGRVISAQNLAAGFRALGNDINDLTSNALRCGNEADAEDELQLMNMR